MSGPEPTVAMGARLPAARRPIRIAVIGGVRLYREGLARLLAARPDVEVVGMAAGGDEALPLMRAQRLDVAIVDVSAPGGLAALRRLAALVAPLPVVALGLAETEQEIVAAAEAGTAGFVSSDATVSELVTAAASTTRGELLCSPRVAAILRRRVAVLARAGASPADPLLTAREHEIAALIGAGYTNREIAHRLCVEVSTVKNHVRNIFDKLRISHREEVAARLRALGEPLGTSP